jgi:hypothetical protein
MTVAPHDLPFTRHGNRTEQLQMRLHEAKSGIRTGFCLLAFTVGACTTAELRPASGVAVETPGFASDNGIGIRVGGRAWSGDPAVLRYAAPIHVTIHNASGRPIRLQYESFALIYGREDSVYPPLTPQAVETTWPYWDHASDTGRPPPRRRVDLDESLVLPEGVLASGEQQSGFLFFRRVVNNTNNMRFWVILNDASSGLPVARLSIPLTSE